MFSRIYRILFYASAIYTLFIAYSVPCKSLSKQCAAEGAYWMFFPLVSFHIRVPSIPIAWLQEAHSSVKVIELFPQNDSLAIAKFAKLSAASRGDQVVILRSLWDDETQVTAGSGAVRPEIWSFNSFEAFRNHCDLSHPYNVQVYPKDLPRIIKSMDLGQFLDVAQARNESFVHYLVFELALLENQPALKNAYENFLGRLELRELVSGAHFSQAYLYQGSRYRTTVHNAIYNDYFLQVSGIKQWTFMNVEYFPYLGAVMGKAVWQSMHFRNHFMHPDSKIPYTVIDLRPGDLMYFPPLMPHQVVNKFVETDRQKLGFAIGIRAMELKHVLWSHDLLAPYTMLHLRGLTHSAIRGPKRRTGTGVDRFPKKKKMCSNDAIAGKGIPVFNGETLQVYKYVNESCKLVPVPDR